MISVSIITRYTRCFAFQFEFLKLSISLKTSLINLHKTGKFSINFIHLKRFCIFIVHTDSRIMNHVSLFTDKHPTLFIIIDSLSVLFSLHKANVVKKYKINITYTLFNITTTSKIQNISIHIFYLYFLITIVLGINI